MTLPLLDTALAAFLLGLLPGLYFTHKLSLAYRTEHLRREAWEIQARSQAVAQLMRAQYQSEVGERAWMN